MKNLEKLVEKYLAVCLSEDTADDFRENTLDFARQVAKETLKYCVPKKQKEIFSKIYTDAGNYAYREGFTDGFNHNIEISNQKAKRWLK